MKEIILLLCGLVIGHQLMAQTFSEWFRQNHTQLKYLAGQLTALKGYDGLLLQGYGIEEEGLDSIGTIDADDEEMHAGHFSGLDESSAAVREDAAVDAIEHYCHLLPIAAEEIEQVCRGLPVSPDDWPTIGVGIGGSLRRLASQGEIWLEDVLMSDRYRMDDAGRLRRLAYMLGELRDVYGQIMFVLAQLESSITNPLL